MTPPARPDPVAALRDRGVTIADFIEWVAQLETFETEEDDAYHQISVTDLRILKDFANEWQGYNEGLIDLRDAIEHEASAGSLDVLAIVEQWRTTYDTIIHKGLIAYAVEDAWEASVSPVGDPEDGIEQHDLGVLANGIVDALLARLTRLTRLTRQSSEGSER